MHERSGNFVVDLWQLRQQAGNSVVSYHRAFSHRAFFIIIVYVKTARCWRRLCCKLATGHRKHTAQASASADAGGPSGWGFANHTQSLHIIRRSRVEDRLRLITDCSSPIVNMVDRSPSNAPPFDITTYEVETHL